MSDAKRPSLAATNRDVEGLSAAVDSLTTSVERLKSGEDFEATVAGKCARSLDALAEHASRTSPNMVSGYSNYIRPANGGNYDFQPLYSPPTGPVPRVLDYLRQRYGVPDPSLEARRLSAEVERAYQRISDLEARLQQISGAVSS